MMSDKLLWWLVALLVVFRLILVGWWPFLVITDAQRDATIVIEQAMSMLDGDWLGPYSELTLLQGPVTTIWIALMHFFGFPLLLSQQAIYVGACVLALLAARALTGSRGFQLGVFAVLLLNPYSYNYELAASAVRETLHQSLTLGILALSTILFVDLVRGRIIRKGRCFLLGLLVLLLYNNGDSFAWVILYPGWLMFVLIVQSWLNDRLGEYDTAAGLLSVVLIPLLVWSTGTLAIAWKNYLEYEVFAVVEANTTQPQSAVAGLKAIDAVGGDSAVGETPANVRAVLSLSGVGGEVAELPSALAEVYRQLVAHSPSSSVIDSFSTGSPVFDLGVSRLVNSPVRVAEKIEYFLPDFFKRTAKNKTRYLNKLVETYRAALPVLFWTGLLGLILRLYRLRKTIEWGVLDSVLFGLGGTLLAGMVMVAVARVTGSGASPDPYAMLYPVLYLFVLTSLLSLIRDIREIKGDGGIKF